MEAIIGVIILGAVALYYIGIGMAWLNCILFIISLPLKLVWEIIKLLFYINKLPLKLVCGIIKFPFSLFSSKKQANS
jgi:hypothetical protein